MTLDFVKDLESHWREKRKRGRTARVFGAGENSIRREIGGVGEKGGRERGWSEGPRVLPLFGAFSILFSKGAKSPFCPHLKREKPYSAPLNQLDFTTLFYDFNLSTYKDTSKQKIHLDISLCNLVTFFSPYFPNVEHKVEG